MDFNKVCRDTTRSHNQELQIQYCDHDRILIFKAFNDLDFLTAYFDMDSVFVCIDALHIPVNNFQSVETFSCLHGLKQHLKPCSNTAQCLCMVSLKLATIQSQVLILYH